MLKTQLIGEQMNNQLSVIVSESPGKGRGVFAGKHFKKNEIVIIGKPVEKALKRTWQTVQMDVDTHVRMDEPFELVNHSCDPNCGIKMNEFKGYNLVAMKDIAPKDEITFDYCMSEWVCIAPSLSHCKCQSNICRKSIRGGQFVPHQLLEEYHGFLAPYYEKLRPVSWTNAYRDGCCHLQ